MPTYKALSVRQPDAYFLVKGYKPCENRSWTTKHWGPLVIHAGAKKMTKADWAYLREICNEGGVPVPAPDDPHLQTGALIGAVYLAAVTDQPDPEWEANWWDGESVAWMIDDAVAFAVADIVPMKGKLQLFDVELPTMSEVFLTLWNPTRRPRPKSHSWQKANNSDG